MHFLDAHTHSLHSTHSLFNVMVGKDSMPNRFYSAGIHPWYVEDAVGQMAKLKNLMVDQKCLAIGECGLDKRCDTPFGTQMSVFRQQILLALEVQKPLIIHCVKAFDELLKLKAEFGESSHWVIHGFNQNPAIAKRLIDHGFYFSLGSALLNPTSNAVACLSFLPIERLLLETDDAKIDIRDVYNAAADALNLPVSELVSNLQANCEHVFGIIV